MTDLTEVELQPLTRSGDALNIKQRDDDEYSGIHVHDEVDGTTDNGTVNCPQPVLVLVLDKTRDIELLCGKLSDLGFGFTCLNTAHSTDQDDKLTGNHSDLQFIGIHMTKKVSEKYAEDLNFHVRFAKNITSDSWGKIPAALYSNVLGYSGFRTMYYSAPFQSKYKSHYINLDYIYSSRVGAEIVHTILTHNSVYKIYHVNSYFVPHTTEKGEKLTRCYKILPLCPLEEIRNYYGEEIAFVYAWNNLWMMLGLLPLAVICLLCVVYGAFTIPDVTKLLGVESTVLLYAVHLNSNDFCYVYGIFMITWMAIFQYQWTKISSLLSLEWGTSNFNIEEEPLFKPSNSRTSKISKLFIQIPNMVLGLFGFIATCLLTLIMFIVTEIIRTVCYNANLLELSDTYLEFTVTCICSVFYSVLNLIMFTFIIPPLVRFVTNMENHRFRSFYDNSIIFKYGGYYIISSYLYLVYLIFFRNNCIKIFGFEIDYLYTCDYGICSMTICEELLVQIFILRFYSIITFCMFKLKMIVKKLLCERGAVDEPGDENVDLRYIIKNYKLFPSTTSCLLPLMIERIIMYGYITLFSFQMPVIAFIGWIIEFSVTKIELHLLSFSHRPLPRRCQNLGQWEGVLHILDVISIITTTISIGISLGSQGFETPHAITLTILPIFIVVQCLIRELNRTSGDYVQSHKHNQFEALQDMTREGGTNDNMIHISTEL